MNWRWWFALGLGLTVAISASLGAWLGYQKLEQQARSDLFRYTSLLQEQISRFQLIPPVLASNPVFLDALVAQDSHPILLYANELLEEFTELVEVSDIYLMDKDGVTIATSNWNTNTSFLGKDFSFRPYFSQAMTGTSGFYYALGTTSGVRGFYFSYPVADQSNALGVITLKASVTELEQDWHQPWSNQGSELVVTDPDNVVFLSTRRDWRYHSLGPLSEADLQRIQQEKRYGNHPVQSLNFTPRESPAGVSGESQRLSWSHESEGTVEYLRVSTSMPGADWTVSILANVRAIQYQQYATILLAVTTYLAVFVLWLYFRERKNKELLLIRNRDQLEINVAERTRDLESSNQQLIQQIRERQKAEEALKAAQEELIQAAKLATLGQMSAGINHELNQPITSISAFAENARQFLQKQKYETVDGNLKEIHQLCQRMAGIVKQFKMFARKSEGSLVQVDLVQSVKGAVEMMRVALEKQHTEIQLSLPDNPVPVLGDMVRIEQVIVNLISNAMQAMIDNPPDQPHTLFIFLLEDDSYINLSVSDNGPGLPKEMEKIFEPFYTTKSMSQGLGLGLSISRQIADTLNGTLTGHNLSATPPLHPQEQGLTGARFTLLLPRAPSIAKDTS